MRPSRPYSGCGLAKLEHQEFAALVELAEGYEQWEADLIEDREAWEPDGMAVFPRLTQSLYDRMMELQMRRNVLLARIREKALGGG